jgi:hypothetical protein
MPERITNIDLNGSWEFASRSQTGAGAPEPLVPWDWITVPGCWEAQGFGLDTLGPALYRRRFEVPATWPAGTQIQAQLACAGVSYACQAWLDGRAVGSHEGMWDAFELPLGQLAPGASHELLIAVEKQGERFPTRETPVGFLPDLGVTFGGIWQPIEIRARGPLALRSLGAQARLEAHSVELDIAVENELGEACDAELRLRLADGATICWEQTLALNAAPGLNRLRATLPLGELALWSPDAPYLYQVSAEVTTAEGPSDRMARRLGLRELRVVGDRILLNGRPLYLRGVLSWGWHERRLCPTPSEEELRAELEQLRGLGFNLVKHCLYVPPARTLELADELGMLSWIELPLWLPRMSAALRARLRAQYPRIARQRAHHAGLLLWTLGCELNASVDGPLLRDLYNAVRAELPGEPGTGARALLRDNSGSGECYGGLASDSADFYDYHFYCDPPFLPGLVDAFAAGYRPRRPWLFGEFNDSDTWRSIQALAPQPPLPLDAGKGKLAPRWWLGRDWSACPHIEQPELPLAKQAETLAAEGLPDDPAWHEGMRLRSNLHAALLRKLTLERVRQYPQLTGYVVTVLRDQPISTAGLLDDLGRLKVDPAEFRRFNADCVLSLAWDLRRTWLAGGDRLLRRDAWGHWAGQPLRPHLVLANFGPLPLDGALRWRLAGAAGETLAEGLTRCQATVGPGEVQELATLELVAPRVGTPTRVVLYVELEQGSLANSWPLWIYPQPGWEQAASRLGIYGAGELAGQAARLLKGAPEGEAALETGRALLATRWDARLAGWVEAGGQALLVAAGNDPALPTRAVPFWREALKEQLPHPAWGDFVQDAFGGAQLHALTTDHALDPAQWAAWPGAQSYAPILRRIDARRYHALDYLAELGLGAGRLIISTLRFGAGLGETPSALATNVTGQALLWRLLGYLGERT